jgi:DNA repair exonuclease SbcCD ATPase subunit
MCNCTSFAEQQVHILEQRLQKANEELEKTQENFERQLGEKESRVNALQTALVDAQAKARDAEVSLSTCGEIFVHIVYAHLKDDCTPSYAPYATVSSWSFAK